MSSIRLVKVNGLTPPHCIEREPLVYLGFSGLKKLMHLLWKIPTSLCNATLFKQTVCFSETQAQF